MASLNGITRESTVYRIDDTTASHSGGLVACIVQRASKSEDHAQRSHDKADIRTHSSTLLLETVKEGAGQRVESISCSYCHRMCCSMHDGSHTEDKPPPSVTRTLYSR